MINYLKGNPTAIFNNPNHRTILILEVNQVGYEMQVASRFARQLSQGEVAEAMAVQVFTHLQMREDQPFLYGFATAAERDLFRQLIGVSGIGAQLAIALIDTLGLETLVQAIVTGNIRTLSQAPGVGQKTAERIALELKTKLSQWRQLAGVTVSSATAVPAREILEDVEMTLLALGYTNDEIQGAISALSQDRQMLKNTQVEEWIRSAIAWLSQEA